MRAIHIQSAGRHGPRLTLLVLALLWPGMAAPAGVAGRVVDRSSDPVPGARVTFTCGDEAAALAVTTDENGRFLSPRLAEGECAIEATLPALNARTRVERRITERGMEEIELKLDIDMISESVVVRGVAIRDGVESREIRESPARDAGEALTRVDGIRKIRKGGIANDISLRGFKAENLSVLIDGERIYGACPNRMDPALYHVDFAEIERIDVKKGPFDMAHSGSLGGTVNVVTKEPDAGAHGSAQVAAGSYSYLAPSLAGSYAGPTWSASGGYAARWGDAFEDGHGVPFTSLGNYRPSAVDEQAFDIRTGWVGASFQLRPAHRLEVRGARQEGDRQLYPYLLMDADYDDADRWTLSYAAQGPFGVLQGLEASFAYATVSHFMTDALRTSSEGTPRGYSMATQAESEVVSERLEAKLARGFAVGVEAYQRNWNTTTLMAPMGYAPQGSIPNVDVISTGVYGLYDMRRSGSWNLQAGVRFDRVTSDADPSLANTDLYFAYHDTRSTSGSDSLWSASLSATLAPAEAWELFAGVGRTARAPDPQERYFALKRKDADWVGNPTLRAPENLELDLGARFRSGAISVEASVFGASVADFVAIVDAQRVNAVPGVMNTQARSYVNVDARLRGGEATLQWAIGRRVAVTAGMSIVRGEKDVDPSLGITDPDLPEMAPLGGHASVRYDSGKWFAEVEGVAAAEQDRVDADLLETRTPGWGIMHVRGGMLFRRFSILAGVANVFDRFYRESLSYQRDPFRSGVQVPEPGRSFSVSVQLRY